MSKPFILITNDDGYQASGLEALASVLSAHATVAVVAPETDMSGVSQKLTLLSPLRARQRRENIWSVDGTPTDCVYLALAELLPRTPDLVVSGINRGPNLADDVMYSGTLAGAREAVASGVSALAVSQMPGGGWDYGPAARLALQVVELMLDAWSGKRLLLNLNVPSTNGVELDGFTWCPTGRRDYRRSVARAQDPRGRDYFWIGGNGLSHHPVSGSDCDTIAEGKATLTPISMDFTDHAFLKEVAVGRDDNP